GDKDPFALRRHALGVIRMLIDGRIDGKDLNVEFTDLVAAATAVFGDAISDPTQAIADFVFDRLTVALRDQGWTPQEVDAVLSKRPTILADVPKRLAAVRAFAALPEAAALAAANKRIGNILKKSDEPEAALTASKLVEPAEKDLEAKLAAMRPATMAMFANGKYQEALTACAALRAPVDAFFDAVMVNDENQELRRNRLALLRSLHELMNEIADLSRLAS
ncbi:MAG: glycine--tRNA ligase subunit beta, partial [Planctomycetes bacterium]|nr:glycine--tRNA ligase subunit beta [Planctomycetota bacterium]